MKKKNPTVLRTQYRHVLHVFNTVLVVYMMLSFLSDFSMLIKQKILPKTIECQKLPFFTEMIKQMPDVMTASISVLEGKSELRPHRGYYKGFMRYHLGILVPTDHPPVLTVADKKYYWKEGEGVIFDDMHIHKVSNPSSHPRIVLFLDIIRNDLPPAIDTLNRWTIKVLQGFIAEADAQDHANLKVGKK